MSNDQFFEEEEDLARSQAQASARADRGRSDGRPRSGKLAARGTGASAPSSPVVSKRRPPSFALVVAIAVVALVVGVCVGYFIAMAVVDRSMVSNQVVQTAQTDTATSTDAGEESGMPDGHPDISSMLNPDGTVNEEAVEAYKAEHAASQTEEGDDAGAASATDGETGTEEGTSQE